MKKANGARRKRSPAGGLARNYRFDYGKSKPNRFAGSLAKDAVVVVLDPDVALVFRDSRRVNSLLRATITALRRPRSRRTG